MRKVKLIVQKNTRGRFYCVPPLCSFDTQDRLVSEKIGGIEKVKYIYDKRSNIAQKLKSVPRGTLFPLEN